MNPSQPHRPSAAVRDLWNRRHSDCTGESEFGELDEALYVRAAHGGHGPQCLQSLGADAYLGGRAGDDYE